MQKTFQAVYKDGVLHPLETLALSDDQHVQLTISGMPDAPSDVAGYFQPEEWETSKHDDISLEDVRHALSSIPGSLV